MAPTKSLNASDLVVGGLLQCAEAATFGMPFEVWKTHMGTYRDEGTIQSLKKIYKEGGIRAFWKGWEPKMVESFLKGGILLFAKEGIIRWSGTIGLSETTGGVLGGFGGGCAQVGVLGPCTFLITAKVAAKAGTEISTSQRIKDTWKQHGIKGFYRGGTALMLRQGTNWASRQGITDLVRSTLRNRHADPKTSKLSMWEELLSGVIGGALSTWNQPFEVLRIEAQAAAARGQAAKGLRDTCIQIWKENGFLGFYQGSFPRMGLGIVQTVFMVTIPYLMKK